jgi:large subunit ribosomal protein L25
MMEIVKLSATQRPEAGKGPARRLRRTGQIPAVAYGRELSAKQLAVSPKSLLQVLSSPHGQNSVVELDLDGKETITVMVRDYAYHPLTRELIHADFVQVKLDQPVDVEVPFVCTGKPKGVTTGGILQQIYRRLPVRALPTQIPLKLEADTTELDIGDSLKASQLTLPAGVKVRLPDDQTIVVVAAPEKITEEETKPGAPAAGAAPGAAAPAAAAAAAPAKAGEKGGEKAAPAKAEKKK